MTDEHKALVELEAALHRIIETDDAGDYLYRADGPCARIARAALKNLPALEAAHAARIAAEAERDAAQEQAGIATRDYLDRCQAVERLQSLINDCSIYLKDGETPRQRMDRDHADILALMKMLSEAKIKAEAAEASLREATALLRRFHEWHTRLEPDATAYGAAPEDLYSASDIGKETAAFLARSPAKTDGPRDVVGAEARFAEWFRKNYPGPDTIIHKPEWHAPKIFRAALAALRAQEDGQCLE